MKLEIGKKGSNIGICGNDIVNDLEEKDAGESE